ncbi:hypothetical protein OVA24_14085 [Luteolibacter sp. SL250]|uniref:hypothetical protein n=1 Tax=Luteolibacter sp. SL250 TaxID=2995170 RepID=UPI00226EF0A4|nr:hypothetical protein [Luteolibacter sp. SL250]WAC18363.1 hypothetical protein OVA24_14085 [Luteolibacter sp. SL250]
MKPIARFDSPEEAYLFRSFLASRGIGSAVLDEYVSQLFWNYRFATGGVRVVLEDDGDREDAEILKEEYLSALSPEPEEEVVGWPVVAVLSLVMGVPMPVFGKRRVPRKDDAA